MLSICSEPGCTTMVIGGGPCVSHEPHVNRVFLRGRPFVQTSASEVAPERQAAVMLIGNDSWQTNGPQPRFERPV